MKYKAIDSTGRLCSRDCDGYQTCERNLWDKTYSSGVFSLAQKNNHGVMVPTRDCPIYTDGKVLEIALNEEDERTFQANLNGNTTAKNPTVVELQKQIDQLRKDFEEHKDFCGHDQFKAVKSQALREEIRLADLEMKKEKKQ